MTVTAQLPLHLDADVIGEALRPDRSNLRDWLAVRRTGITGTDLPAILGMSKYNSPLGVYVDKLGEIEEGDVGEAAEWGLRLEPVIAEKFAEVHRDLTVHDSPGVLANRDRRHLIVNVDRLVTTPDETRPRILEIKTTNQYLAGEWDPDNDEIPAAALLQTHHELAVTGAQVAHVAALIGGQRYVEVTVTRDEELVERICDIADEFWQRVERRDPPPPDGSKATTSLLGRLYQVDPESVVVLDPDAWARLRVEREVRAAEAEAAKDALAEIDNQIKALLGPAEVGVLNGDVAVTWKLQHRGGYEVAPSSFRVLRVKKNRG